MVDLFLAGGWEVVGVDAMTGNYCRERKERNLSGALGESGFRFVEEDLLTCDLDGLLRGVEAVVHLAGEPGVRSSWGGGLGEYLERNVLATGRVLESVLRAGVPRLLHASSSSVYGSDTGAPLGEDSPRRPVSPYGLSKLAAEELVGVYARERGVEATVLRYFNVYGPRQRPEMALARFLGAAKRGEKVEVYGDGEQVREMTCVFDAVEATVAALDAEPGTYNVGGGSRVTVNGLLEVVRRVTGAALDADHRPRVAGDAVSTWADCWSAERAFGYRPKVGLEDGVRAQAEWVAAEGPGDP